MEKNREKDEHLERLWYMKEERKESIAELKKILGDAFNSNIVDELERDNLVELQDKGAKIMLTEKGEEDARHLIRAHRLAERLLHDVLGGDFESGACEFEHTVNHALVDSICTLLGHPRECPHGLSIPKGDCCKVLAKTAHSSIIPLTELEVGQCAMIAYVNCRSDQRLHKMEGLNVRPGSMVKLHQTYPSYVIECDNVNIALDREVASDICVWREPCKCKVEDAKLPGRKTGKGNGWGRGFRFRQGEQGSNK